MLDAVGALITGLTQVLTWPALGFLLGGIGIGYVVGLLPGVGGPAAMALVLPFVHTLGPVDAVALVGGMAAVTVMAGDLTSILLGVPGEATSTAIMPDGHALARRGHGGFAAGAATAASLFGAVTGAVALALLVPLARPLVGAVQSPELVMLALLAVGFVLPLSSRAPLKGLLAGVMGLLLATVGLDPSSGTPRFTFGQLFLWEGIGLLPVALGLFAVPEALALVRRGKDAEATVGLGGGALDGIRQAWTQWRLVVRCSLIGLGIGVLPGVGASTSQWLAYAHAAQNSSRRASFGTGEIEGVLAPGAASAATLGGALVPTLALGIPGSVTTAFILGALVLLGLTPGPEFLLPERHGGHLALVFSFVWTIILANALTTGLSFVFLDSLARLARTRSTVLFPVVLAFILLGAVAEKNSMGDLAVVAVMGCVGLVMSRLDWPKAPLLLGLMLGPLVERRLLVSFGAYGAAWMLRPGVLAMAALIVVVLGRNIRPVWAGAAGTGARSSADRAVAGVLLMLGIGGMWCTRDLSWSAGLMPRSFLFAITVLSGLLMYRSTVALRAATPSEVPGARAEPGGGVVFGPAGLGWLAFFVSSVWLFGLVAGTGLSCAAFLRLVGRDSWRGVMVVTGALTTLMYLLANRALGLAGTGVLPDMLSLSMTTDGTMTALGVLPWP